MPRGALNPIDKHVGSRVRMGRRKLNMSQTDLGNALGLTFQQVQKYEKGSNRVSASRLQQLSKILQVTVPFGAVDVGLMLPRSIRDDCAGREY